ncbi:MAG: hypothetical protein Q7R98_00325 [Candidatus Jorgensenbacteria bacterium]|nr:hypothetical protein [Candidatus Jorgensenbacteria bacterium]
MQISKSLKRAAANFLGKDLPFQEDEISEMIDYDELARHRKSLYPSSKLRKLIEVRMIELNTQCADYGELMARKLNLPTHSQLRKSIEVRMMELNAQCADYRKLAWRLENSRPGSKLEKQIGLRMIELNAQCTDYAELARRWKDSHLNSNGFILAKQIGLRMMKLSREQLPSITDYAELVRRRKSTYSGSKLRKLIEARMVKIVRPAILDTEIPKWVTKEIFDNPPDSMRKLLQKLAQKICK